MSDDEGIRAEEADAESPAGASAPGPGGGREAAGFSLLERLPAAVIVHREGLVVWANAAARLLAEKDDLAGEPVLSLAHPDDRAKVAEVAFAPATPGESRGARELRYLAPDGRTRAVEVESRAVEFEGQASILTCVRDVSDRKLMEARLLRADRMAALGGLAAGLGHEINNPLASVVANLRFVFEALSDVAGALPGDRMVEVFDALEDAEVGAERVRSTVSDLDLFARADAEEPLESESQGAPLRAVDPRRVIEKAVGVAFGDIRHRARLARRLDEVPPVVASEAQLGQVVLALLLNAVEALEEGAADRHEIQVSTRLIGVGLEDPAARVVIEVRDDGPGIAPEHLPRLFDPLFTTKPEGAGRGLGLHYCQGVVQALGGEIRVESEPGRGSAFQVELRPAPPESRETRPAKIERAERPSRRGCILVVDDEPLVLGAVRRLLETEHEVVAAQSGRDALRILSAGARFDVILCDVMMPEMTGADLHAQVAALSPEQAERMVFLTGGAFTPRARRFLADIRNRRLQKPFDGAQLRALVGELIE